MQNGRGAGTLGTTVQRGDEADLLVFVGNGGIGDLEKKYGHLLYRLTHSFHLENAGVTLGPVFHRRLVLLKRDAVHLLLPGLGQSGQHLPQLRVRMLTRRQSAGENN